MIYRPIITSVLPLDHPLSLRRVLNQPPVFFALVTMVTTWLIAAKAKGGGDNFPCALFLQKN